MSDDSATLADWLDRHGLADGNGDGDGDGATNRKEYDGDTNPTNGASVFAVTDVEPGSL